MTPLVVAVILLALVVLAAVLAPDAVRGLVGAALMLVPLVIVAGLFFAFCTPR